MEKDKVVGNAVYNTGEIAELYILNDLHRALLALNEHYTEKGADDLGVELVKHLNENCYPPMIDAVNNRIGFLFTTGVDRFAKLNN